MRLLLCLGDSNKKRVVAAALQRLSAKYQEIPEIKQCKNLESVTFAIQDDPNYFDLIILETELFGKDGIEITADIRDMGYTNEIIFFSADKYKVFDSFITEPLYYILDNEKRDIMMEDAFDRARKKMHRKRASMISLSCAGETRNIDFDDINYFIAEGRLVKAMYGQGEEFKFYAPISKIEDNLFAEGFIRIHRGIVVNASKIKGFNNHSVTICNGEELPFGKIYYNKNVQYLKAKVAL